MKAHHFLKRVLPAFLVLLCSYLLMAPLCAEETGSAEFAEADVAVSVIVNIDSDSRNITLRDPFSGEEWVYQAGPEVRNFDQLERGDIVIAEYFAGLALALEPKGSGLKDRFSTTDVERAPQGQKPGMSITESIYVEAVVSEVDVEQGIIAIEGPERVLTMKVADDVDLGRIEVGQEVEALYVESYAISVEPAPKVSGTVRLKFTAVALGVGVEWGKGVLTMYDGSEHEFKVTGLTVLDVGISTVEAEGEVYRLVEASDLEGTYLTGQAGAALVEGGSALAMKNTKGVVMKIKSAQQGVRLTLAAEGLKIKLK